MRRLARAVSHGAVLLLIGFATLGGAADTPDSPAPTVEASPSREFQGVWYRTPEKRGGFAVFLASGNLTVSTETISFDSKKLRLTIATASVKRVASARFPDDPANTWIVVEYDDHGSSKAAAFKDAGLGRDTKAIQAALLSSSRAAAFARGESPASREKPVIAFDSRTWRQGFQQDIGTQAITEYVLPDETVNGWTELVSVQTFPGAQETTALASVVGVFKDKLLKECPDALWRILKESQDEVLHEWKTTGCRGWDNQHEIAKLMKGKSAIYRVSYANRSLPLEDEKRAQWVELVGAARIEEEAGPANRPASATSPAIAASSPGEADAGTPEGQKEFEPYQGLKEQFTIALPVGWQAHDQSAALGKPGPYGVVIFSPVNLGMVKVTDAQKSLEEAQKTLEGIDTGEIPSLLVDRHKAEGGMSCDGFSDKARKKALETYEISTMGRNSHIVGTPEAEAVSVGGCQGLRVRLRVRDPEGSETHLLVYAVSDGKMAYDFFLRNRKDFFEKNLPTFEKAISTIKVATGRAQ
jgi:hypothetical protein